MIKWVKKASVFCVFFIFPVPPVPLSTKFSRWLHFSAFGKCCLFVAYSIRFHVACTKKWFFTYSNMTASFCWREKMPGRWKKTNIFNLIAFSISCFYIFYWQFFICFVLCSLNFYLFFFSIFAFSFGIFTNGPNICGVRLNKIFKFNFVLLYTICVSQ